VLGDPETMLKRVQHMVRDDREALISGETFEWLDNND